MKVTKQMLKPSIRSKVAKGCGCCVRVLPLAAGALVSRKSLGRTCGVERAALHHPFLSCHAIGQMGCVSTLLCYFICASNESRSPAGRIRRALSQERDTPIAISAVRSTSPRDAVPGMAPRLSAPGRNPAQALSLATERVAGCRLFEEAAFSVFRRVPELACGLTPLAEMFKGCSAKAEHLASTHSSVFGEGFEDVGLHMQATARTVGLASTRGVESIAIARWISASPIQQRLAVRVERHVVAQQAPRGAAADVRGRPRERRPEARYGREHWAGACASGTSSTSRLAPRSRSHLFACRPTRSRAASSVRCSAPRTPRDRRAAHGT